MLCFWYRRTHHREAFEDDVRTGKEKRRPRVCRRASARGLRSDHFSSPERDDRPPAGGQQHPRGGDDGAAGQKVARAATRDFPGGGGLDPAPQWLFKRQLAFIFLLFSGKFTEEIIVPS